MTNNNNSDALAPDYNVFDFDPDSVVFLSDDEIAKEMKVGKGAEEIMARDLLDNEEVTTVSRNHNARADWEAQSRRNKS